MPPGETDCGGSGGSGKGMIKLTCQAKIDAAYLREYVAFGASAPITVGECLYKALLDAHGRQAFESVAHLQLRLLSEMIMCLEMFGALLLAYSRWDKPGGILATLLGYSPGDVPKFIKKIKKEHDALRLICFPAKDNVLRHYNVAYTDEEAKKMIMDTCDTYIKKHVRGAYNTIKHAGLPIRHPQILMPPSGKALTSDKVYLTTYFEDKVDDTQSVEHICFRVTGEAGISTADNFLYEIRKTSETSRLLAHYVADFLKNNFLRPSVPACNDWEQKLDKRARRISGTMAEAIRLAKEKGTMKVFDHQSEGER